MLGYNRREDLFHKSCKHSKLGSQSKGTAVLSSPGKKKCYLSLLVICHSLPLEAQAIAFLAKGPSQEE